ncbi:MAG: 50S ribosomal protein L6 [Anaerolineales bacterium]|nr:50S ribosomal protein L6 [Anaerolineales bacterium]
MSRIGRMPITLPEGVRVEVERNRVTVTGPKGSIAREFHPDMAIEREDGVLKINRPTDQRHHRALHGLTRALLNNMVVGVTEGFKKQLEIQGVGYRVELQPEGSLLMTLGLSHTVTVAPPEGITFEVESRTRVITVHGIDKELVGRVAAEIRAWRPPEPYLGRGIRYLGEHVRRKAGKAGKAA